MSKPLDVYRSEQMLIEALKLIETICTESAGDCRKRMGTRVGNALVTARAALAKAEGRT